MSDKSSFHNLQTYQEEHDKKFHSDIHRLSDPDRLRHFQEHFAKYTGRLAFVPHGDVYPLERILADAFIIFLAASNVHLVRLDASRELKNKYLVDEDAKFNPKNWLLNHLAYHNGNIAKACEARDHMENYDYKEKIKTALIGIAEAVLITCVSTGMNIKDLVWERWKEIEKFQIL